MANSMCCFWCPAKDYARRELTDKCPRCGRAFGLPLEELPMGVAGFRVVEALSRGFYGAAYRAVQESLGRTVVLKMVPTALYAFFGKDWALESKEHAALAENAENIASIIERFDADVTMGSEVLPCHVVVLQNVQGPTLQRVLLNPEVVGLTPRIAAQIAGDLFQILQVLAEDKRFHNDLHAGNVIVQRLEGKSLRVGAIEPSVRAVAIDLGSIRDESQSGDGTRLGDSLNVARHLRGLAQAIRSPSGQSGDTDFRIAMALQGLSEHLAPAAGAQRVMTADDALRTLRFALTAADEPWRTPLQLARFQDGYNAQALESWHVPELWFDPQNRWLSRTTARGPQVITGMRGCGKTMLLRALHFHARAKNYADGKESGEETVGVYASCQKLLNPQDQVGSGTDSAFERLFVAYLRDACQVLRHLRSVRPDALNATIDSLLRPALKVLDLQGSVPAEGELQFEQFLTDLQFRLADGEAKCRLRQAPAESFGELAATLRAASPLFAGKYVLFLLDDVSTRYLRSELLRDVISKLIFQHADCAFRITTEAHALHRVLLSPGGSAPADPNRDYEEFDLGNEVYRLLQEGTTAARMGFVSEILKRRGRHFPGSLYEREPSAVLGDVPLEEIAKEIATSSTSSPTRKRVYRGLRSLQAVCVGDLGEIVKLYERILSRADALALPVPEEKQTECFLEHAATLVHFLNRRDQQKKNLALAFAQASGELLQQSARTLRAGKKVRYRQYTKLYVRVDAGPDAEEVANGILDLLDAGVFVYDGGVPRSKTRDSDPVLQFKLSFRKMLGLASFIGLSDRDRFELSGNTLKEWLKNPSLAKRILLDSEAKRAVAESDEPASAEPTLESPVETVAGSDSKEANGQYGLFDRPSQPDRPPALVPVHARLGLELVEKRGVSDWSGVGVDAVVLAMGFEERALASAQVVLEAVQPKFVVLVNYQDGQGLAVRDLAARHPLKLVHSVTELSAALAGVRSAVVDSTGLSKNYLFTAVRDLLLAVGEVHLVHTLAAQHFPRNEDLAAEGIEPGDTLSADVLATIGEKLRQGEVGPYSLVKVHKAAALPERPRALIASASPKNDRLLFLLDERVAEATRLLVPAPTTPRKVLARFSAQLATSAADSNVRLVEVDTNDIKGALEAAERLYEELYYQGGANVELGLTGPKVHAVALAALAAAARISAVWYVAPSSFDAEHFTKGVGRSDAFTIRLRDR